MNKTTRIVIALVATLAIMSACSNSKPKEQDPFAAIQAAYNACSGIAEAAGGNAIDLKGLTSNDPVVRYQTSQKLDDIQTAAKVAHDTKLEECIKDVRDKLSALSNEINGTTTTTAITETSAPVVSDATPADTTAAATPTATTVHRRSGKSGNGSGTTAPVAAPTTTQAVVGNACPSGQAHPNGDVNVPCAPAIVVTTQPPTPVVSEPVPADAGAPAPTTAAPAPTTTVITVDPALGCVIIDGVSYNCS